MTSSTRQFRPHAVPTIVVVFLVPLFCGLGIWQLERAEQKRQLAASLEARRKLPAHPLNRGVPEADKRQFRTILAEGRFLRDKTVLIENRKHQGRRGFHVITPLMLSGSAQIVLVNRGWIGQEAPDAEAVQAPTGEQRISGHITLPEAPALEMDFPLSGDGGMPRWPYLTLENFTAWSGLEILPFAILQSPDDPGGLVRDWPQPRISDAMHIGYAIQWFAFALIALLIWYRLSLSKASGGENLA